MAKSWKPISRKAVEGSQVLRKLLDRLGYFVFYQKKHVAGASAAPALSGKAALAAKLTDVQNEKAAGEKITHDRLREFHTFNWLLSSEAKAERNKLVKEAFNGAKGGAKAAAAPKTKGTKRKADEKTAGQQKMEAEESTLNLFR